MQDKIETPALPTGSGDKGAGDMAAELMADLTGTATPTPAAEPPATPAAPATPSTTPQPPKPAFAPTPPKPAAASPTPKPAPATPAKPAAPAKELNVDDPKLTAVDLRRHLKEITESGRKTVTEKQQVIDKLEEKIRDFEKKRFYTEADIQAHEAATAKLAQLESALYSRDYAESPEYKTKFQDRLDKVWGEAKEEGKGLTVTFMEGEEEKTRPATERDLLAVIDAPIAQRMALAKKMFGDDRDAVLGWAREIGIIRKEATAAVAEKQKNYTSDVQKQSAEMETARKQIVEFTDKATEVLKQKFPEIFTAPADQPEIAEALRKGFAFVDETVNNQHKMDASTRAARIAMLRANAAAFPRLLLERNALIDENTRLREENGKYRKTDPSELGGGGGGGDTGEKDGGSDAMAAEIDNIGA